MAHESAKSIELFQAGRVRDSAGRWHDFSQEDLNRSAQAYDRAKHEAPLVCGHPAEDAPAYGWVDSLSVSDGRLAAIPHQVDPSFAELVNAGRFKKVSASFYAPGSPVNPVPGVWYLRHVGFLGAQPPAVHGLRDASFKADDQGVVEFADVSDTPGLFARLLAWASKQPEAADFASADIETDTPPGGSMTTTAAAAPAATAQNTTPAAAAPPAAALPADFAEKQAELERKTKDLQAREAELAAREQTARRTELADFAEALVKDGARVLPADKDALVAFMAGLDREDVIEFAEADKDGKPGAKVKKASLDWFKDWLKRLPKQVDFAERSAATGGVPTQDPVAMANLARAYQTEQEQKGITVSAAQAVAHVKGQGR